MIKKIHCKFVKNCNNYVLVPNQILTENELLRNYVHNCIDYDIECIFDLRKEIINSNINGKLYFYLAFKKDKNVYMNINFDLKGKSFISDFNRTKKKKNIEYEINTRNFDLSCQDKYIYLGYNNVNFRDIAYESKLICHTSISKMGKGFYAFNLDIENNLNTNYIDLIISDKPFIDNIENIVQLEEIYPFFKREYEEDFIEPSAPPMKNIDEY